MRVKFKINLGSQDARQLGLDFTQCVQGAELDVSDPTGEVLIVRNMAAQVVPPLKAVPAPPDLGKAKAEEGTVERATEDLVAYREKQNRPPAKPADSKTPPSHKDK